MAMKPLRERNPIIVAIVGLVILAAIALLTFDSANLPIIGGGTTYTAYFAEDAGLQPGNEVRIAGVIVGQVTGVSLAGNKVAVTFKVKNAWVGDQTTAAIEIKTLLGDKYLALDPQGTQPQNPGQPIPLSRTTSPYDVTQAFQGFGQEVSQINTAELAKSLETFSAAFAQHAALRALRPARARLAVPGDRLPRRAGRQPAGRGQDRHRNAGQRGQHVRQAARRRQPAAGRAAAAPGRDPFAADRHAGAARQLSGLVNDNQAQLGPALRALDQVTTILERNQANLTKALSLAGPYYRLLGNALGNGRWFDVYLCGLIPHLPAARNPSRDRLRAPETLRLRLWPEQTTASGTPLRLA